MKKYLFIVLLVGVCFGQDVYPYFSDMEKQLQFERQKVTIEKSEGVEQLISGGGSAFKRGLKELVSMQAYTNLTKLHSML